MKLSKLLFGLLMLAAYGTALAQSDEGDNAVAQELDITQQEAAEPAPIAQLQEELQPEEQLPEEQLPETQLSADEVPESEPESRRVRRLGDVIGEETEEFSMDFPAMDIPQVPVQLQPDVTLPDPQADAELQNLLTRRAFLPDDPEIEAELSSLLDGVENDGIAALAAGDLALAQRLADVLEELDQDRPLMAQVAAEQQRLTSVDQLVDQAAQALAADSLLEPAERSAWSLYEQVLALDPENAIALAGQDEVRAQLRERISVLIEDGDFETASEWASAAETIGFEADQLAQMQSDIQAAQIEEMDRLLADTRAAIDSGNFDDAEENINALIAFGADEEQINRFRTSLDDAIRYGGFVPGQLFQDGLGDDDSFGPVMMVVPAGSFVMGSPEDEDDRLDNEGPQFRVTFERGFALARNEVTVGQFRRFISETNYRTDAERNGSSRIYREGSGRIDETDDITWRNDYLGDDADDELPVIHISFNDAQAYADWLARRTGRPYRLPSEAEFEYSLRAGTTTQYWWGDDSPEDSTENVTGDGDLFDDQRTWTNAFRRYEDGFWGPAPVGSLAANPFGLFDLGGNVMEWLEDCWHDSYVRAPDDGTAWVNPGCNRRMLRGASWSSTPAMSRSAYRLSATMDSTDARVGFRVARDL